MRDECRHHLIEVDSKDLGDDLVHDIVEANGSELIQPIESLLGMSVMTIELVC